MFDETKKYSGADPDSPSRRTAIASVGAAGLSVAALATSGLMVTGAHAQQGPEARPLADKTAVVTGARNNIGRAMAVALAAMGANVAVHYHRQETRDQAEETARLVREAGGEAILAQGDLGQPETAIALYDATEEAFGGVDIAVNTAGTIIKKPIAEFTDKEFEQLLNDNTRTMFYSVREAARRIRDGGRIINVGTSLTAGTAPQYAVYGGTKAPVEEFTRMVARELPERKITVNCIAPGPIDNPFFHAQETPESTEFASQLAIENRLGTEQDLVPVLEFLVRPESLWVNGQTIWVNNGYLTR